MQDKLTYQGAGVDTKAAASLVDRYKEHAARTQQNRKLFGAFGLFAAAYDLSAWQQPVLVTGCDGVGTKLEPLLEHDLLEIAGVDLVAMSVNDVLTTGGDPLLFLDYLGIAKLDPVRLERLVAGIADALAECNCILAGGETAEMPGVVPEGVIEISGFCIGCVEKKDLLDPSVVKPGDVLLGWKSAGFHANGWSLVRKVLQQHADAFSQEEIRQLLAPTKLYHNEVSVLRKAGIKPAAYAHITGGGLPENLERVLGEYGANLTVPYWEDSLIQRVLGFCDSENCWDTFNMGIGWVAIVDESQVAQVQDVLPDAIRLGEVVAEKGVRLSVAEL